MYTCIRGAKYLVIKGDSGAYWSNVAYTRDHSVVEDGLVEQIKFLVFTSKLVIGFLSRQLAY